MPCEVNRCHKSNHLPIFGDNKTTHFSERERERWHSNSKILLVSCLCSLDIFKERGISQPSVRPHVDQPKTVSSIDLIVLFIVEKGSDIFQGFCNCAPNSGSLDTLLSVATSATMLLATGTATAIIRGTAVGCLYLSKAFAC